MHTAIPCWIAQQAQSFRWRLRALRSRERLAADWHRYRCNVCNSTSAAPRADFGRETGACHVCGSTVRLRSIVHVLSCAMFDRSLSITEFPARFTITGVGISDWPGYARPLACKFRYWNTFLHRSPRLDLTAVADEYKGLCSFVICSDVMEHLPPPVAVGFAGLRKMLKPNGLLILSVPLEEGKTLEHFPELHRYSFTLKHGRRVLHNITRDGRTQNFEQLTFHGGPGETLEMRVFGIDSLVDELASSGFTEVTFHRASVPERGIFWDNDAGVVVTARATADRARTDEYRE